MDSSPQRSIEISEILDEASAIASKAGDVLQDEYARRTLLSISRRLTQALEAPHEVISDLSHSGGRWMCVRIAIDLKIFHLLKEKSPRTVEELASAAGAQALLIMRIMRTLAAEGYVQQIGEETFAVTELGIFLTIPSASAGVIHWYDCSLPAVAAAPKYFLQNHYRCPSSPHDGPVQFAHDTSLNSYAYWQTIPGWNENFNVFMNGKFTSTYPWHSYFPIREIIIDGFDNLKSEYLFVDVGGGRGHEALALKTKFPDAKGKVVVEDLPAVIEDTPQEMQGHGIERLSHDFFAEQPIKNSRVYFMQAILHNWPDESSVKILNRIGDAMLPGYSRLLVSNYILPNRDASVHAVGLDIGMLVLHSGMQRSEKQWNLLMKDSGLKVAKFWYPPQGGEGVIEVIREY